MTTRRKMTEIFPIFWVHDRPIFFCLKRHSHTVCRPAPRVLHIHTSYLSEIIKLKGKNTFFFQIPTQLQIHTFPMMSSFWLSPPTTLWSHISVVLRVADSNLTTLTFPPKIRLNVSERFFRHSFANIEYRMGFNVP